MKVLIAYATTEGQTKKIAEKIANQVRELGHVVELIDTNRKHRDFHVDDFNAIMVAASVHQDSYQDAIELFVVACRTILKTKPTMFVSVSLSAAFDEGRDAAQNYIAKFSEQTGWIPTISLSVAGALRNEGYDYYQQQILEHIVLKNRNVDRPERDHEFTDWKGLAESVETFLKTNSH
jgi:menaquinone-dependent protoporphyrinogen oxidase